MFDFLTKKSVLAINVALLVGTGSVVYFGTNGDSAEEPDQVEKSIPLTVKKIEFKSDGKYLNNDLIANNVNVHEIDPDKSLVKTINVLNEIDDKPSSRFLELKKIALSSSESFNVVEEELETVVIKTEEINSIEEESEPVLEIEDVKITKVNQYIDNKPILKEEFQEIVTKLPEEAEIIINVRKGDSLSKIFSRAGLSGSEAYKVNKVLSESKSGFMIYPGDTFNFRIDDKGNLKSFVLSKIDLTNLIVKKEGTTYKVDQEIIEPNVKISSVSGIIKSNLFLDAKKAGLNESMIMELADVFKWDIDFALDLKKNDKFSVVFEEKFVKDSKIGNGDILAARFENDGRLFEAVRHIDDNGKVSYYTPEGKSLSKAFIRSPVDFRRISSSFKKERYHPVLGVKRPHKGTDYAAATGTPIKASGSGKIIFAGTKGGYGKTIIIKHPNGITTLYGHQSRFAKGIRKGKGVTQGQTIGYVGKTGVATGPHLHYEFRVNGVHKNPMTVELPNDKPLNKNEISRFKKEASKFLELLNEA